MIVVLSFISINAFLFFFFFFQAEDGIRDLTVTGVQTCALPIYIEVWNAVMAPASMPAAHRARLSQALERILHSPEVRDKLLAQGWRVDDVGPAALSARMAQDNRTYGALIAKKNIRLD